MLKHLKLKNIGPASSMDLVFGERLNLITGDNGLGKSFLLDIAWWSLTRKWPAEINPRLTCGSKALPRGEGDSSIGFSFTARSRQVDYVSTFLRREQAWTGAAGRPANPGLVFYAMSDGSFALWDPARNYWRTQNGVDIQDRQPAYVFTPAEVWDGIANEDGKWLCNGLIRDWASWQIENGRVFKSLCAVLKVLSPSAREPLVPGELTRISLDDVREMPTLRMPYGQDVPLAHISAGMRRIIGLAYFLVWVWEEHNKAARLLDEPATAQAVFLIDEVESHLHPQWQRKIVPALLVVMKELSRQADVQLITATHSPLVMTSVEPVFDDSTDSWFDLDFERRKVKLTQRPFEKQGDAGTWLTSEAFNLPSSRSIEAEELIGKASRLLEKEVPGAQAITKMNQALVAALSPKDDFLFNWRYICKQKGWLE